WRSSTASVTPISSAAFQRGAKRSNETLLPFSTSNVQRPTFNGRGRRTNRQTTSYALPELRSRCNDVALLTICRGGAQRNHWRLVFPWCLFAARRTRRGEGFGICRSTGSGPEQNRRG